MSWLSACNAGHDKHGRLMGACTSQSLQNLATKLEKGNQTERCVEVEHGRITERKRLPEAISDYAAHGAQVTLSALFREGISWTSRASSTMEQQHSQPKRNVSTKPYMRLPP